MRLIPIVGSRRRIARIKIVTLICCLVTSSAWAAVELLVPAADAVVFTPHPHFGWKWEADAKLDDVHQLQIARDKAFTQLVCEDRLAVVSRFVPVKPLAPGKYWWRVRREGPDRIGRARVRLGHDGQ